MPPAALTDQSGAIGAATIDEVGLEAQMPCLKLVGDCLTARDFDRQTAEFQTHAAILNRFTRLGTPKTRRVA